MFLAGNFMGENFLRVKFSWGDQMLLNSVNLTIIHEEDLQLKTYILVYI